MELNILKKIRNAPETKKKTSGRGRKREESKPQEQTYGYVVSSGTLPSGTLPLSLSIKTQCGLAERIAEIGATLPLNGVKVFSTGPRVPEAVGIKLFAGEHAFAENNLLLTAVKIEGIRKMPNGRPLISVAFEVDDQCNIRLEAIDEGSLNSASAMVPSECWPSKQAALDMVREAQNDFDEESERIGKLKMYQMIREGLYSAELKYKSVQKKLAAEKRRLYKQNLFELKARITKMKASELTERVGQSLMTTINELNAALSSDNSNSQDK